MFRKVQKKRWEIRSNALKMEEVVKFGSIAEEKEDIFINVFIKTRIN